MPFAPVVNDQAYAKIGLTGLQGSGKSRTATEIAIGLHRLLVSKGLRDAKAPVYMCDTETGSSWLRRLFVEAGIGFEVDKTRSFTALVNNMKHVASEKGILVIDSITHYWKELCEAFAAEKKISKLEFHHWGQLKKMWSSFTDPYVNDPAHYIMCGRQGFEYEMSKDENGKKQIERAGVKMKAEGETGYEPSLLVVMERHQELANNGQIERVWRTAYVLKDRADLIDGKSFENPTFESFAPHINALALGGEHVGVKSGKTEINLPRDDNSWRYENEQREILCEEIQGLLVKHFPSQGADDKKAKSDLISKYFETLSWTKVTKMAIPDLKRAYNRLHNELEKKPAYADMPLEDGPLVASEATKAAVEAGNAKVESPF